MYVQNISISFKQSIPTIKVNKGKSGKETCQMLSLSDRYCISLMSTFAGTEAGSSRKKPD